MAGEFDRAAVARIVERAARAEADVIESDAAAPDVAGPDAAASGGGPPDAAVADLATSDVTTPDVTTRDQVPLDPTSFDIASLDVTGLGDDDRAVREAMRGHRLDAETIVAAAAEVGIAPHVTRRSIAIERLGPPPPDRFGDRVVGPRRVVAQRTVGHDRGSAVDRIDEWLTDGHHLRREARETTDGSIEVRWVRRSDLATGVWRRMRGLRGEARLGGLRNVTVRAAPLDDATTMVRMSADRSDERTALGAGGAALAGAGAAGVGLAATGVIVAGPFALLAAPFVVGGALYAGRGRAKAEQLDHELTRVLDAVAEARRPPGVLAAQRRLRRSIRR